MIFKPVINNDQEKELKIKGKTKLKQEVVNTFGKYDWSKFERFERDTINNPKAKLIGR